MPERSDHDQDCHRLQSLNLMITCKTSDKFEGNIEIKGNQTGNVSQLIYQ